MSAKPDWAEGIEKVGLLCEAETSHPDSGFALATFSEPMVSIAMAIHEPDPDHPERFTDEHYLVGLMLTQEQALDLSARLAAEVVCSTSCMARHIAGTN